MSKFKQLAIVYPVIVMFVICLVITAALAGTNVITRDRIEKINQNNENAAKMRLIEADEYAEDTVELDGKKYEYSTAQSDGETKGYIFKISENGYGGRVSVMIAVNTDGTIKAVELLDVSSETPGLGQNTAQPAFTKQFEGKTGKLEAVKHGTVSNDMQIDAVASATITSRAVTSAVNKALELTERIRNTADTDAVTEPSAVATPDIVLDSY